jgi:hypothetical protein
MTASISRPCPMTSARRRRKSWRPTANRTPPSRHVHRRTPNRPKPRRRACSVVGPTWHGDMPTRTAKPRSLFAVGTGRTATKTFARCPGLATTAGVSVIGRTRDHSTISTESTPSRMHPLLLARARRWRRPRPASFQSPSPRHRAAAPTPQARRIGRRSPDGASSSAQTMTTRDGNTL